MMYALRLIPSKMFLRAKDGGSTVNKESAMLFSTIDEARVYVTDWRTTSFVGDASTMQISIVEVETVPVIKKVGKEVEIV